MDGEKLEKIYEVLKSLERGLDIYRQSFENLPLGNGNVALSLTMMLNKHLTDINNRLKVIEETLNIKSKGLDGTSAMIGKRKYKSTRGKL